MPNWVWSLIVLIVSLVAEQLLAVKPTVSDASASTLDQFQLPQHDEGTPQNVVFGDVWIEDPMILWYGDLNSEAITKSSGGGKK